MTNSTSRTADTDVPDIFNGFISEPEYCEQRGISRRTAQRDRQLRQSPPYVVIGKRVYYRIESVRQWLRERECKAERRATAPRTRKKQ